YWLLNLLKRSMKSPESVTAKYLLILISLIAFSLNSIAQKQLLIEAESFDNTGGWVIDQQSFPVIQSSYLMAHGMGRPVEDATTTVRFEKTGKYHLWVRTKDWAPFPKGPGRFAVIVDGEQLGGVFGESGVAGWKWYYGGEVTITNMDTEIRLKDLSGFNGRCDALLFSTSKIEPPQDSRSEE